MRKFLCGLFLILLSTQLLAATKDVGVDTHIVIRLYDSTTFLPKTGVAATAITCDCVQDDLTTTSWTGAASGSAHDIVEITSGTSQALYSVELVGASDLNVHGKTIVACKGSGFVSPPVIVDVVEDPAYQRNIVGDMAIPDDVADIDLSAHTTAGTSGAAWNNMDVAASSMSSGISAISTVLGTPVDTDFSTDIAAISTKIGTPAVDLVTDLGTHDAAIKALLPAALVGGKIDAHVNDIAANAITATSIATDAITADKIAADSIGASEIAANAIGASEIATDAIGSAELAASAILKMGIVTGTAQSGGNSSITLAAGDAGTATSYTYGLITITGGTGQGQQAIITAYNSGTKVATIFCQATASGVWTTNPDLTSVYSIIPGRR